MKNLKLLFTIVFTATFLSSCSIIVSDDFILEPTLEEVVSGYDLWYVDYHRTYGNNDVPFVSKAFTLSFINGVMYANNNIVDIGRTGNGLGIDVGTYNTFNGILQTFHDLDGYADFDVTVISNNEIEIYNYNRNVSYFLVGYNVNNFDYDRLFYENIEYFLQEYAAWEKVATNGGNINEFDAENFLQFTPENITTFYSSQDNFGTQIDFINWDYIGSYEVFNVAGFEDLKILTLNYDGGVVEEFELTVTNDNNIRLYHIDSGTTYSFRGRGFIQFLKGKLKEVSSKDLVRNNNRKRIKVVRKIKERRHLK